MKQKGSILTDLLRESLAKEKAKRREYKFHWADRDEAESFAKFWGGTVDKKRSFNNIFVLI